MSPSIEKLYVVCLCKNELLIDMNKISLLSRPSHDVECSRCGRTLYFHRIANEKQQGTDNFRLSFDKPRTIDLVCCSECGSRNIKIHYSEIDSEQQYITGIECFDCQDSDYRTSHCSSCIPRDGCAHHLETTRNPKVLRCTNCKQLYELVGEGADRKLRHLKDAEGKHAVDSSGVFYYHDGRPFFYSRS